MTTEVAEDAVHWQKGNILGHSLIRMPPNPDEAKTSEEESGQAEMTVYIDGDGTICGIRTSISEVPTENNKMVKYIQTEGLFGDTYSEQVILDGNPCREEMVWDFEKYFGRFFFMLWRAGERM